MNRFFLFLAWIIFTTGSSEAQMMSSYLREQTGTLPRGRFMISVVSVQSSIDRMYSRSGERKNLSSNLNRQVDVQTIVSDEPVRGSQLEGLFLANGMNLSDSVGKIEGSIRGKVDGKVPVVGFGVSDDLGIFFNLPVIEFQVDSAYRFEASAQMKAFLDRLRSSDQTSVAKEFESALQNSLATKLYRSQYQWNSTLKKTALGDARITAVKVLENRPDYQAQVQPFLIFPTATGQDLHDLYGLKAGDRRLGLGVKYSIQKQVSYFQFNASVMGTHLFEATQGRRVPKNSEDDLNELLDENVTVTGGDQFQSQFQIRYSLPKWVSLNVGLDWKQRWNESWAGSRNENLIYRIAEEKTGSSLFSSYASLDLNTIQSFLEGKFLFPAIAEIGVGMPISGKNAIAEPVVQLQGTMFF